MRYPVGGLTHEQVIEIRRIKARVDTERLPRGADPATHAKLGRGGLADVEWAVQLLQLRHGHEVAGLRTPRTLDALAAARDAGLISRRRRGRADRGWSTASRVRNALMLVRGRPSDQLPRQGIELAGVVRVLGARRPRESSSTTTCAPRGTRAKRSTGRLMRRSVAASTAVAMVLAIAFLLAPLMGTDLSAQVAHADFFRSFGGVPIDLRWYGGTNQFGYSLISPAVMSVTGAKWLGAISAVVASGAFAYVLAGTGARRPAIGGVVGAICLVGNIASGRITFAFGVAFGMLALALIVAGAWPRWARLAVIAVLGLLATLASPVAGLFTGLAAGALMLADAAWRRWGVRPGPRFGEALALGGGAALGLVPMTVFGDAGTQPFTVDPVRTNVAIAVVVIVLVPLAYRAVRVGAVLAIALLLFALYVPSAIGSNSIRLTMLFAIPVIVALTMLPRWPLLLVVVALIWWQNPVLLNDIANAGAPETRASFYQPLLTRLGPLGPIGRIEVVPLRDHWESSFVADAVPLARGWERQVDVKRNPIFYNGTLTPTTYGAWLRSNAVSYVALPVGQPLDTYAKAEAAVVREMPSYLTPVWQNADWQLYAVAQPQPFVAGGDLGVVRRRCRRARRGVARRRARARPVVALADIVRRMRRPRSRRLDHRARALARPLYDFQRRQGGAPMLMNLEEAPTDADAVTRRATAIRYGGFAGSIMLAIAGLLGGAFVALPMTVTPVSILQGPNGGWILGLWLAGTTLLVTAWWKGLRQATTATWALVTATLWIVPMLFTAPYGSRDVYAYACQGAVYGAGHNPYHEGVAALPCPWVDSVSVIWRTTPTPYGATWLMLERLAYTIGGSLTGTVVMFRLYAIIGLAITAAFLPMLARAVRMPVDRAIWIALACPLVIIHLVGGAHSDALLAGFIVAGLAVIARRSDRWTWLAAGGVLLGVAVSMKITIVVVALPFATVLAVGGGWHFERLVRRGAVIIGSALAVVVATSVGSGLGFGWIGALSDAGDSVQWTSPPTAVGLTISYLGRLFGLHVPGVPIARVIALVALASALVAIWWRFKASSPREGDVLYGAGLALAATVLLAPIMQAWYLTWALAVCSVVAMRRTGWLMALAATACFLVLPDGISLAKFTNGPLAPVVTVIIAYAAWRIFQHLRRPHRDPEPADTPEPVDA